MSMEHVRLTVSLLAPRVRIRGTKEVHYVGILNRQALSKGHARAWGPIGGAATTSALPEFRSFVEGHGVSLYDQKSPDLRLHVPVEALDAVMAAMEPSITVWGQADLERELREELGGKELRRVSREPVLRPGQIAGIRPRFLRSVRQPKNGGFVRSQRADGVPTKRLLFLYELEISRNVWKAMCRSPLIREFRPEELPGADDPPAEPIVLEDGTERRGHLLRVDDE